jgi:Flp pilus assembly protein CpaB
MKRLKIIAIAVLILAGIVAVLINNRSKLEAKTNTNSINSYPVTTGVVVKRSNKALSLYTIWR